MRARRPVVAIGLDATQISLIERLCEEGRLPTIRRLREQGRFGRIQSDATYFASSVWPTFYNSARTEHHGWYYGKMWHPEKMRLEFAGQSWLPQEPFWETLDQARYRIAILDMPYALSTPRVNGVFVSGWQTHDAFGRFSHPSHQWREIRRRFGRPSMRPERFGEQTPKSLSRLRQEMLDTLEQSTDISRWLLETDSWDLFMIVLGSIHRGTHYLWDLSQIDSSKLDSETRRTLEAARDELYVAADRAVARILDSAPSDALVLVFSLHGMGANPGWADRSSDLVAHVHRDGSQAAPQEGRLYRWKRRAPWRLIREVTTRLPVRVNKRFVPLWSSRMFDWSKTRFFPLPVDINGYIRVNLKGREPRGIVEPGAEYDALLTELEDAFRGYRTIETGEPIVRDVVRVDDIVDAGAPRRYLLPDIVLLWAPVSLQKVSGVVSERYGELRWGKGAALPSGRSGNHLPDGWLVACGAGIEQGPDLTCDSIDLVPTIYRWLGAEPSPSFQGRLIEEIVPTVR